MADKPKRPERFDLNAGGKSGRLVPIAGTALIIAFAVALVFYIVNTHHKRTAAAASGPGDAVRVTATNIVTAPGGKPKAVVSLYEDFLCPACGNFERGFGPTVSKLIDIGAVAADYSMVSILDSSRNQNYSSRAGAAALCVADESLDAFRRFHSALYSKELQPSEAGTSFPDNARLIELARESGAAGSVPECIKSGKNLTRITSEAEIAGIRGTPTIKINGEDYQWSTPEAFVEKIKTIVGEVPGIDSAAVSSSRL